MPRGTSERPQAVRSWTEAARAAAPLAAAATCQAVAGAFRRHIALACAPKYWISASAVTSAIKKPTRDRLEDEEGMCTRGGDFMIRFGHAELDLIAYIKDI